MKVFKKLISVFAMAAVLFSLCACSPKAAKCEVVSAEFVDSIQVGSIFYNFEGYDIVKIVINAASIEKFAAGDVKDDEFRQNVYKCIIEGCSLDVNGSEEELKYGYWPKEATDYKAQQMSLFYCVPEGTDLKDVTFKLDGKVLGDAGYQFSYTLGK